MHPCQALIVPQRYSFYIADSFVCGAKWKWCMTMCPSSWTVTGIGCLFKGAPFMLFAWGRAIHVNNSRVASSCDRGEAKELELKLTPTDINGRFINRMWSISRYVLLLSMNRRLGYIPKGLLNCGVYNQLSQKKLCIVFLHRDHAFYEKISASTWKGRNLQIMTVAVLLSLARWEERSHPNYEACFLAPSHRKERNQHNW